MKRNDIELLVRFVRKLKGNVINSGIDRPGISVKEYVFLKLAPELKEDNSNFRGDKFKAACGL